MARAQARANNVEMSRDGRVRPFQPDDPIISQFYEHLKLDLPKRSERTSKEYVRDVERFGAFLQGREPHVTITGINGKPKAVPYRGPFGDVLINATSSNIRQYIMHLGRETIENVTVRRIIAALRAFYTFVSKTANLRPDNPAVDLGRIPVPKASPKALPLNAVEQLLEQRRPVRHVLDRKTNTIRQAKRTEHYEWQMRRDMAILELLYASGIRRAELVSSNIHDLNIEQRTLRVVGKGGRPRTVPFNHATKDALEAYLAVKPHTDDGALFVSQQRRRLSHQQAGHLFRIYAKLSGVAGKPSPHSMRHSLATHLIQNGVDIVAVQKILGHANIGTTGIYLDATLTHIQKVYEEALPRR